MPTQAELDLLLSNPEAFLRQHAIRWAGKAPDAQQNITAAMIDAAGDSQARIRTGSKFLGFGNAKANVTSFVLRDAHFAQGHLGTPGTLQFPAVWSGYLARDVADADLPAVGGPGIMFTPEFTGCAAVCEVNVDGSAKFSHYNLLQPDGRQTLDAAGMRMRAEQTYDGDFALMTKETQRAFGKAPAAAMRSTIIGFRRHGRWEFWAQHREAKPIGTTGNSIQIRAVVRLK